MTVLTKVLVSGAAGKLGSVFTGWLANKLANKLIDVHAYDVDSAAIEALKSGKQIHHDECDWGRVVVWDGDPFDDQHLQFDLEIIIVATPSEPNGTFDCGAVHDRIRLNQAKHYMVISTVNPGELDEYENVIYSPTLIALGEINFDGYIVCGIRTDRPTNDVSSIIYQIWEGCDIVIVPIAEAQIIKLAINCYLTTKISYANAIADLCKSLGARPDVVLSAVGRDKRIGGAFLKPGRTYSGPCLPRDTKAMIAAAKGSSGEGDSIITMMQANECVNDWMISEIVDKIPAEADTIGIIGMAYKAGVPYDWASTGNMIIELMRQRGDTRKVWTYCPWNTVRHGSTEAFRADYVINLLKEGYL